MEVEKPQGKGQESTDLRTRLNQVINVVNVTAEATQSIHKLVGSIDGIVKQVSEQETPENRVPFLEKEANDLVAEIQRIANQTAVNGVHPLAGDRVVLEVREELGRQLEIIFPNDARDGFGISTINFSRKEAIIDTRAKIKLAWKRIEELQASVHNTSNTLKETAAKLEVAMQNSKAAEATPHDLDAAMTLASDTSLSIAKHPDAAMGSFGPLKKAPKTLLE